MYDDVVMPGELDSLVVAYCADYTRRADVISKKNAPYNVIMEYRFLNYRIMNAAVEIAGTRDAIYLIKDIGENGGYAKSNLCAISEKMYKERKRVLKIHIAKRLSLI